MSMSRHISFDQMTRLIDPTVKTTLCMMQDLSHLCTIDLAVKTVTNIVVCQSNDASNII
jgi:hypothetical protein